MKMDRKHWGVLPTMASCMPCFDKVNNKSLESTTIGALSGGMETKITATLCLTSIKVDTNLQKKKKKKNHSRTEHAERGFSDYRGNPVYMHVVDS